MLVTMLVTMFREMIVEEKLKAIDEAVEAEWIAWNFYSENPTSDNFRAYAVLATTTIKFILEQVGLLQEKGTDGVEMSSLSGNQE